MGLVVELTDADERRASSLHAGSFVFDFSPLGDPIVLSPPARSALQEGLRVKRSFSEILRQMSWARLDELRRDPHARAELRDIWEASGVDAMQVTLGVMGDGSWETLIRDTAYWHERSRIGSDFALCTSAAQLREARDQRKVGVLLGVQDTLPIGNDLSRLETLHSLGVRVVQLTYNRRNLVGDGCTERHQAGLSHFGVDVVHELNRLGMVVDAAHCGVGTTLDAVDTSEAPIAYTHTCARAVADHARGKTDEQLRALAETDGYVGVVAVPFFLRPGGDAQVGDMMDHLEHVAGIVGTERVGIGTDWGIWSNDFPAELREAALELLWKAGFRPEDGIVMNGSLGEFAAWTDWPQITRGLVSRGFGDDDIRGFLGENWLGFLDRVGVA